MMTEDELDMGGMRRRTNLAEHVIRRALGFSPSSIERHIRIAIERVKTRDELMNCGAFVEFNSTVGRLAADRLVELSETIDELYDTCRRIPPQHPSFPKALAKLVERGGDSQSGLVAAVNATPEGSVEEDEAIRRLAELFRKGNITWVSEKPSEEEEDTEE